MYWNRFDICEAWWLFLSEYHEGLDSDLYGRLGRLTGFFRPRRSLSGFQNLTENGLAIYERLVSRWRDEQTAGCGETPGYSHACGYHD